MTTATVATWIVRHRYWVAAAWIVTALLLVPVVRTIDDVMAVGDPGVEASESVWVDHLLATRFASPFASSAILVATGLPSPTAPAGRVILREVVDSLIRHPEVTRTMSYLDTGDGTFANERGMYLLVGLDPSASGDSVIMSLRAMTASLQLRLRREHAEATLTVTGAAAFNYDVRLAGAAAAATAERRVIPATVLVLVVVFGGVVAAVLPITIGVLAILLSLGAAIWLAPVFPVTILLRNVVSMLGLGLGIDYALLAVSRFREAMVESTSREEAAITTVRYAGHTVVLSGSAVAIGFAALLLVPARELRSLAAGGLLVTGVAVLLATTLLPTLLTWRGGAVARQRRFFGRSGAMWRRWGAWVADNPLRVLCLAGIPMMWLAWQARRVSTDIPSGNWLPPMMESTRAAEALAAMGRSGEIQTVRVVVELPNDAGLRSAAGWRAVSQLSRTLESDSLVAEVRSLPVALNSERLAPLRLAFAPDHVRGSLMSRDGRLALIELVPHEGVSPGTLVRYVRELRSFDPGPVSGMPGVRLRVGGLPSYNADYQDAIGGSLAGVIALIIGGSVLALFVGFRSVLIPLKAVALNLCSVVAAIGAAVLVFQDGHGARWIGLDAPVDGIFPAVPVIVFSVVFGLSMDYEVFLVARVAEGVRRGMTDREALIEALARTGSVITSAALVMIVVFVGFAAGDFLIVKILGFTLGVAVLLDATIVRLALGPALLRLAGRWNWWPSWRRADHERRSTLGSC